MALTNQIPAPKEPQKADCPSASCCVSLPVPYYDAGGITIYHGDNRQILPMLGRFDLLLTDPPYGIGEARKNHKSRGHHAGRKVKTNSAGPTGTDYGKSDWDDETPAKWLLDQMIHQCERSILFGGNFFDLPPSSCWLVWDKDNGSNDFADCELAWTNLPKAVRRIKWRWCGMIQEIQNKKEADKRWHPTQKPEAVMKWSINQAGDVETILDPFAGSGTTGRAAKDLGKRCVMIEREERYCEIAALRLSQDVLQFSPHNA